MQSSPEPIRCWECGYLLVGLEGTVCPECGVGFDLEELRARYSGAALRDLKSRVLSRVFAWLVIAFFVGFFAAVCTRWVYFSSVSPPPGESEYWFTNGFDANYNLCMVIVPMCCAAACMWPSVRKGLVRVPRHAKSGVVPWWLMVGAVMVDLFAVYVFARDVAFFD